MTTIRDQCSNCQMLEKQIVDANTTLKKFLSLKSKIFHTDTLIRKFQELKDENLRLVSERDKAQNLCAKYEIDLKQVLEEAHFLRQAEKDLKSSCNKYEAEILSMQESLQAEKALVKQYKGLIETEDKPEEQARKKAVKDLEKKLCKKDEDLQKSREKNRDINKKLNLLSKSHVKALKFLKKLGNHPVLEGLLPAGDKRTLNRFCGTLQNEKLLFREDTLWNKEDDILDESQYLENLLESCLDDNNSESECQLELPHSSQQQSSEPSVFKSNTSLVCQFQDGPTDSSDILTLDKNSTSIECSLNNSHEKTVLETPQILYKKAAFKSAENVQNHAPNIGDGCCSPEKWIPNEIHADLSVNESHETILNNPNVAERITNQLDNRFLRNDTLNCSKILVDHENNLSRSVGESDKNENSVQTESYSDNINKSDEDSNKCINGNPGLDNDLIKSDVQLETFSKNIKPGKDINLCTNRNHVSIDQEECHTDENFLPTVVISENINKSIDDTKNSADGNHVLNNIQTQPDADESVIETETCSSEETDINPNINHVLNSVSHLANASENSKASILGSEIDFSLGERDDVLSKETSDQVELTNPVPNLNSLPPKLSEINPRRMESAGQSSVVHSESKTFPDGTSDSTVYENQTMNEVTRNDQMEHEQASKDSEVISEDTTISNNEEMETSMHNDANTESELEEGELVIDSGCETSVLDKTVDQDSVDIVNQDNKNENVPTLFSNTVADTTSSHPEKEARSTFNTTCQSNVELDLDITAAVATETSENQSVGFSGDSDPLVVIDKKTVSNRLPGVSPKIVSDKTEHCISEKPNTSSSCLPTIPFSEDRLFQPGNSSNSRSSSAAICNELTHHSNNVSKTNSKTSKKKKYKETEKKVHKICSRMKHAMVLECPVSPLPPSPPSTPLQKNANKSFDHPGNSNKSVFKERRKGMSDLFGSDSEDESHKQILKGLQHQESEGFDPEMEVQDDQTEDMSRNQEETNSIDRMGTYNSKDLDLNNTARTQFNCGQYHDTREIREHAESHVVKENQSNSRLFTDFTMDPGSGRCKISIRLPDNLSSATNVRFELDTLSKELHVDYGPSSFRNWHATNRSSLKHTTEISSGKCDNNNNNKNYSFQGSGPKITFVDDCKNYSPPISDSQACYAMPTRNVFPLKGYCGPNKSAIVSPVGSVRQASGFSVGHTLHRLADQRKPSLLGRTFDKTTSHLPLNSSTSENTPVHLCKTFKTPPLRKPNSTSENTVEPILKTDSSHLPDKFDSDTVDNLKDNGTSCLNGLSHDNSADLLADNVKNMPKTIGTKKRTLDYSPPRETCPSKKVCPLVTASTSSSTTSFNSSAHQLKPKKKILKRLKNLNQLNGSDHKNPCVFLNLYAKFSNVSNCDDLIEASLYYFLNCRFDLLPQFTNKSQQLPLLTRKEEFFLSLIKRLQDEKAHMSNLVNKFLFGICSQLNLVLEKFETGSASLCRLYTALSKESNNIQMARDLCYNLVLRKHPHAPYLVANVLLVWPSILELSCSPGSWHLWKKVFSLFLLSTSTETQELTVLVLQELGHLESPTKENSLPDALVLEMVDLLSSRVDIRTSEDVCQQVLLLSYMQGWLWTKANVLPPLFANFNTMTKNCKTPVIRLLGNLLHYCGPKVKEDSDQLVLKLISLFKELDEEEFLSKEACIHSLLGLTSQLENSSVLEMKSWLQKNRDNLTINLKQDFMASGFLT